MNEFELALQLHTLENITTKKDYKDFSVQLQASLAKVLPYKWVVSSNLNYSEDLKNILTLYVIYIDTTTTTITEKFKQEYNLLAGVVARENPDVKLASTIPWTRGRCSAIRKAYDDYNLPAHVQRAIAKVLSNVKLSSI